MDKQFELTLQLVFCLDGACNTVTVFEGSRLLIPQCNTEDFFALPGTWLLLTLYQNMDLAVNIDVLNSPCFSFAIELNLPNV